jgi:hypothetical protein
MNFISGVPVVVIPSGPISEEDRNKFNSFETRMPGAPIQGGRYLGAVSCGHSSMGLDDCLFTRGTFHDSSGDAMSDARQLMYDLKAHNEE